MSTSYYSKFILFVFLYYSCNTGNLKAIADIDGELKEASAIELVENSNILWTIEDAGNKNNIYGLNIKGGIIKDIDISNASNIDWEDLTSDNQGNLYIGDFGNNSKNRDDFTIYKVANLSTKKNKTTAEKINFLLPKKMKPKDFEAFFLLNDYFYIFSKENKSSVVIKVPNEIGKHTAEFVSDLKLNGKHTKITSADISDDGKTIVLLNHDKLWEITNFKSDNFFKGTIKELKFNHDSQKEGICFKNNSTVYITDEKNKSEGGNLYTFKL